MIHRRVTRILQFADFLLTNRPCCPDSIPLAVKVRRFSPQSSAGGLAHVPAAIKLHFQRRAQLSLKRFVTTSYSPPCLGSCCLLAPLPPSHSTMGKPRWWGIPARPTISTPS